jgi:uncharacterized membrane protein
VNEALVTLPASAEGHALDLRDEQAVKAFFAGLGAYDHLAFTAGETLQLGRLSETDIAAARAFFDLRYPTACRRRVAVFSAPGLCCYNRPMSVYVLPLLIGVVAGLRAMTAPAVVSWAAYLSRMHLEGTWLAFLGYAWTPYILSALALAELVTDQLQKSSSRRVPMQFGARIGSGGLCGTALGASGGTWIGGLVAGAIGAIAGTLGGYEFRTRLDAIAIGGGILIVMSIS